MQSQKNYQRELTSVDKSVHKIMVAFLCDPGDLPVELTREAEVPGAPPLDAGVVVFQSPATDVNAFVLGLDRIGFRLIKAIVQKAPNKKFYVRLFFNRIPLEKPLEVEEKRFIEEIGYQRIIRRLCKDTMWNVELRKTGESICLTCTDKTFYATVPEHALKFFEEKIIFE